MKKTAVIYTRVSTDTQAEKGYSLRDQEEKIRRHCERNNIVILKHFQEDFSAKNFKRPEWNLLMEFMKKNKHEIDEFIFAKWDRFSRNLYEGLGELDKIKSFGINIFCLEQNIDDSIPENKLLQTLLLVIPEIENKRRSLNVTAGMRRAMKEGRWPWKAPVGYRNSRDENGKVIIEMDPVKAPLIRKIFDDVARGDLNQQDIRMQILMKGIKLSKSNFSRLLRNKFYMGQIEIPTYKEEPAETVSGLHSPIIEPEVFYKVQQVLDRRNKKKNVSSKRLSRPELPLRGYMLCQSCGGKMTGSASKGNGGRYHYYHCNKCGTRYKATVANEAFETLLGKMTLNKGSKELLKLMVAKKGEELLKNEQRELQSVGMELRKQQERKTRLEDNFLDGKIDGSDYSMLKHRVENELIRLDIRSKELKTTKANLTHDLTKGIDVMANLHNLYDNSNIEGKQRIIGSTFPRNFIFEENKVRTEDMNEAARWIMSGSKALRKNEKGENIDLSMLSPLVAPPGLEPGSKV